MLIKSKYGFYRAPDGAGGGGSDGGQDHSDTGDGTGNNAGGGGSNDQVTFTPEQQAHIDRVIGERLKRAKDKWEADAKEVQTKADQEAEAKRLKEQAEWQKLAEQHEARVAELEPQVKDLEGRVTAYGEAVTALLNAKLTELGDAAKTAVEALPGEPDALSKLTWLNANAALFASPGKSHLGTPPKGRKPGGSGEDKPIRPLANF